MQPVGRLFGVDAVLFTTIHEWTKTTIAAQVQVTVEYTLRSAKTDAILFHRKGTVIYNPNTSSGSVLLNMLGDMLSAALTKEIELGRQCNEEAIGDIPLYGVHRADVEKVRLLATGAEVPISDNWMTANYPDTVFVTLGENPVLPDAIDTVLEVTLKA